jgi:hypothetical protein
VLFLKLATWIKRIACHRARKKNNMGFGITSIRAMSEKLSQFYYQGPFYKYNNYV